MNNNYDALIAAASKTLGTTPEALRQSLEKGDVKALSSGLSKSDKEKLRAALKNEELMKKLKSASSPEEAMKLLGKENR